MDRRLRSAAKMFNSKHSHHDQLGDLIQRTVLIGENERRVLKGRMQWVIGDSTMLRRKPIFLTMRFSSSAMAL
jgi:hypothetical protein